jgi:hypothetical protein
MVEKKYGLMIRLFNRGHLFLWDFVVVLVPAQKPKEKDALY